MNLAESLFLTGRYEIGPVITQLNDIYTSETSDAWSRVLCTMGMKGQPLRSSFEDEMEIVRRAYTLCVYGANVPSVFPGWTCQNTLNFCYELIKSLIKRIEGVTDYKITERTVDSLIRVVGTLAPLLPQRALGFEISAPHAVLFVLESSNDSFVYKKNWAASVREGGFCKVHVLFMNVLAKRLLEVCPPSFEAINNAKTPFGHFAGSNALVCTLIRLDREFTGLLTHECNGDTRHTRHMVKLMGFCMNMSLENVKRLTAVNNRACIMMLADMERSKLLAATTPDIDFCLQDVFSQFKYRMQAELHTDSMSRKRLFSDIAEDADAEKWLASDCPLKRRRVVARL
jgi:hypothetical protein